MAKTVVPFFTNNVLTVPSTTVKSSPIVSNLLWEQLVEQIFPQLRTVTKIEVWRLCKIEYIIEGVQNLDCQ